MKKTKGNSKSNLVELVISHILASVISRLLKKSNMTSSLTYTSFELAAGNFDKK